MTGSPVPDYTIESLRDGPRGARTVLVRFAGGRRVKVVVPPARISDIGMTDAIAAAWRNLPRPPGPNT